MKIGKAIILSIGLLVDCKSPRRDVTTPISLAIDTGEFKDFQIGGLPIFIYGSCAEEREIVSAALTEIFSKSKYAKEVILPAFLIRKDGHGHPRRLNIILVAFGRSSAWLKDQYVIIDREEVDTPYDALRPVGLWTFQRLLAHELGHAALGIKDEGHNRMDNVTKNENRIMRELGDTNDRLSY